MSRSGDILIKTSKVLSEQFNSLCVHRNPQFNLGGA